MTKPDVRKSTLSQNDVTNVECTVGGIHKDKASVVSNEVMFGVSDEKEKIKEKTASSTTTPTTSSDAVP